MDRQCKRCGHIWTRYRGIDYNCPHCGIVCTWDTVGMPDYGKKKRKEWEENQQSGSIERLINLISKT